MQKDGKYTMVTEQVISRPIIIIIILVQKSFARFMPWQRGMRVSMMSFSMEFGGWTLFLFSFFAFRFNQQLSAYNAH